MTGWHNKTIGDASRILCVAFCALIGGSIAMAIGEDGIHIRTLIVSTIMSGATAAGYIGACFVEGFMKGALTGISIHVFYKETWLKNELRRERDSSKSYHFHQKLNK